MTNLKNSDESSTIFIHPKADVQSNDIGEGTRIWQFAIILEKAQLGKNCNINCHTFIENDVVIGDHVTLKSGVYIWDGIKIEDNVFIGPNATFVNNPFPRSQQYPSQHVGVTIKTGASIGANATIMGGILIGKYAMIGAGSVVTCNIPDFQLWFGNPARHKGFITIKGEVISLDLTSKTGKKFYLSESGEPLINLI